MSVLVDFQIRERCRLPEDDPCHMRITPFAEGEPRPGIVNYGLSSAGYDLRLGSDFRVFRREFTKNLDASGTEYPDYDIDVLDFHKVQFDYHVAAKVIVPPNGYMLAQSLEFIKMPEDVMAQVMGKSTLARAGACLNMTLVEPGWSGVLTLEIANLTPMPIKLYAGQGIGQLVFFQCAATPEVPYNKKQHAHYQNQTGVTLPRI